jgi:hypothetical protein
MAPSVPLAESIPRGPAGLLDDDSMWGEEMEYSARVRRWLFVVALIAGAWSSACDAPTDRPASWAYLHPVIVVPTCATSSCHSTLARKAGIELEDFDGSYDLLLGEQFVIPGDPNSPLMFLLEGNERPLMPPEAPLPTGDIDLVRVWVERGAPLE